MLSKASNLFGLSVAATDLAQKKTAEARTEYIKAMKLMEKEKAFPEDARGLLKVKIDAVGGM